MIAVKPSLITWIYSMDLREPILQIWSFSPERWNSTVFFFSFKGLVVISYLLSCSYFSPWLLKHSHFLGVLELAWWRTSLQLSSILCTNEGRFNISEENNLSKIYRVPFVNVFNIFDHTCNQKLQVRRLIFANVIYWSRLRPCVDYFICFKFTRVFFYLMFLMDVL